MRLPILLVGALAVFPACGGQPAASSTPLSPSPGLVATLTNPLAAYVGTWSGNYRTVTCSGGYRRACSDVGGLSNFRLQLARGGPGVVGLLGAAVDLAGTLDADGRLVLTGGDTVAQYELGYTVVESLVLRLSVTGELEGDVSMIEYMPANIRDAVGPRVSTATLSSGRLEPEQLVEPFTGRWTGWFEEVFANRPYFIDPVRELSLSLVQHGQTVAGSMNMTFIGTIPLAGRVVGDTVELTGEVIRNGVSVRVVDFTARRGAVPRLDGAYHLELPGARPEFRLLRIALAGPPQ